MVNYEKVLLKEKSDLCLVVGDVTSTMACSIVARKLGVPVAHVEGGIRSGDWTMPEEINRVVTDSITNWFFTTSETANDNLRCAGVTEDRIFFVGNTMIDTLLKQLPRLRPAACWESLKLQPNSYFVVTLHRPANVDGEQQLLRLLQAIVEGTRGLPAVFPVHPRTAKNLRDLDSKTPQPCLTLRDNTERPETITIGTNELIGTDPGKLPPTLARLMARQWKKGAIPPKWDGKAAERIVEHLERLLVSH
jgi:UDP-N-acetylglucosamine 2-epimerase (non-hydrolysing)